MGGKTSWKRPDTIWLVGLGYVVIGRVSVESNVAGCHSMHILYYLRRDSLRRHLVDRTLNLLSIQKYLSAPEHTPWKRDSACCNDHGVADETLTRALSSPTSFRYSIHEDVITYLRLPRKTRFRTPRSCHLTSLDPHLFG